MKIQKLLEPFTKVIQKGLISSIIQFGSSLRTETYDDIDLAVVVRRGRYANFLRETYGKTFPGLDISIIREEEVVGPRKFRFGGHGAHFLYSLIHGKILYGENPFRQFRVNKSQIESSILLRLYNYMEDVRRSVVRRKIKSSIKKRWPKFIRLTLYLLDSNLKYPEVLELPDSKIPPLLRKHKIILNKKGILLNYELLWQRVLNKFKRLH